MGRNKATSNGLVANLPMANCKELIPSSRNQATVHRTVAFYSSSPYPVCQIKNTILLDGGIGENLERTRCQFAYGKL